MPVSGDMLRRLAALNLSGEQNAAVLTMFAELIEAEDARKATQANRKRRSRDKAVTVTGQGCDGHAPPPPSPSLSPTPPITTPTPEKEEPTVLPKKPVKKVSTEKGTRLPDGWMPSPEDCDVGYDLGFSEDEIRFEHAKFTDFWRAKPGAAGRKVDWNATFRNWLRKAADDRKNGNGKFFGNQARAH